MTYGARGRALAVATVGRDRASLRAEAAMEEQHAWRGLDALVPARRDAIMPEGTIVR